MKNIVPLRLFIFDRLYHPQGGYFCRPDFQVGELSSPIDFKSMIGFDDYQAELFQKYPKNAWLTPSEIFKPYYGMSIGNYIKQAEQMYQKKNPGKKGIRIVEAGAGTGSAAQSILFYFQNFSQETFQNLEYHIVEISPNLCQHIKKKLKKSYPRLIERGQIRIINQNIMDYKSDRRSYNLFLEVLDNLPHDKVIMNKETGKYEQMSMVDLNTNQETLVDVKTDRVVSECLELYLKCERFKKQQEIGSRKGILDRIAVKVIEKYYLKKENKQQLFLPTYLHQLMKKIKKNVPQSHLIMGDFDNLVSSIPGINAPIVSKKGEGSAEKKDYNTYLVNRGDADIFFPVDFEFLKYIHSQKMGRQAEVAKSYDFFDEFSVKDWTLSKSGFNPIKEDFGNTSFLLSKI